MRKGKISILYVDTGSGPKMSESHLQYLLQDMGFYATLFDANGEGIPDADLIFNRIYPSLSKGNGVADRAVRISREAEANGARVINPSESAIFDYDKFLAYEKMKEAGIKTPDTVIMTDIYSALDECERLGYPVIMKRNVGGRSKGIHRLESIDDAKRKIKNMINDREEYRGQIILQKFIESQLPHDIRIGIFSGEPRIHYGRTLMSMGKEKPWIASTDMGSEIVDYSPSKEEIDMAIEATLAIGADINEVDITIGPEGPMIIENNLTPGYVKEETIGKLADLISGIFSGESSRKLYLEEDPAVLDNRVPL